MSGADPSWFPAAATGERPTRIFCIPYAGGSAAAFARWRAVADERVELIPVQLPGRGARIRERPVDRLDRLAAMLAEALGPRLDRPFALFGHSMGALLAFETARTLRRTGLPVPAALFVSARRAPQRASMRPPLHRLSDAQLIAELRALDGTPAAVLEDEELLGLMLPIVRADLKAVETHHYEAEPRLDCPIRAFGGTRDSIAPDDLSAWSEQTTRGFGLTMFDGGHFFLNTHYEAMLQIMTDVLAGARK